MTEKQVKKEYQAPTIQVVEFTLQEGIAESLLSGENLVCIEELE
ncbi:MAG TPA: hypothetical protein PK087_02085 [Bacilli bacterium]|nr:MAG: hypothetical protein BWY97_01126 [Tenericutes bacterium ADurb.BinA124]HNZ50735.1 hypothetical protein [Bacilli bacterium]HOH18093.1 hypothetical protein [Bacilli bacterium]HPN61437.1 hypothetical protein [Bacilli bacterium]HPX84491.1 hypothetical protein [Bacilli bacterium]